MELNSNGIKIDPKIIPRKHRKHVISLIDEYEFMNKMHGSWDSFLEYKLTGTNDGWIQTNNREYQALVWIIEMTDVVNLLNKMDRQKRVIWD